MENIHIFRIYGREKGKGKFKPLDLHRSRFVTNLIHASMVTEPHKNELLTELTRDNPDFEFEARKIKG